MEIYCDFEYLVWIEVNIERYTCVLNDLDLDQCENLVFDDHLDGKTNEDVTGLVITNCEMEKFVRAFTENFPNLRALKVVNSGLKKITMDDLKGFRHLEEIYINDNMIEYLPGHLFYRNPKLDYISFENNKIKYIDPEIFDYLKKIETIDLEGNLSIGVLWNSNEGLQTLKQQIEEKCLPPWNDERNKLKGLLAEERKKLRNANAEMTESKNKNFSYELKIALMTAEQEKLKVLLEQERKKKRPQKNQELFEDLTTFISDETTKDFIVAVSGKEFKVHKVLLTFRSPTIAEILKENPEAERLELVDIPVEIFEAILVYLYSDQKPPQNSNFITIFKAASKLRIKSLQKFAAEKLLKVIDEKNALEIFNISNTYNFTQLKQKALEKLFPGRDFSKDFDEEKLMKILEARMKLEEASKAYEEELKKLEK